MKWDLTVNIAEKHSLVTINARHRDMGKDSAKSHCLHTALMKIRIVNDQTSYGFSGIRAATDSRDKLTVY